MLSIEIILALGVLYCVLVYAMLGIQRAKKEAREGPEIQVQQVAPKQVDPGRYEGRNATSESYGVKV